MSRDWLIVVFCWESEQPTGFSAPDRRSAPLANFFFSFGWGPFLHLPSRQTVRGKPGCCSAGSIDFQGQLRDACGRATSAVGQIPITQLLAGRRPQLAFLLSSSAPAYRASDFRQAL